jgi:hypothetical protein
MEIKRNARTIAAARKAWRWCLLIPLLGGLSAGNLLPLSRRSLGQAASVLRKSYQKFKPATAL